jgi:protocatechuate 3,4-dioxygenase, alpha subunit
MRRALSPASRGPTRRCRASRAFAADGETGEFTLRTVKPGPVALPGGGRRRRTSRSGSWRGGSTSGSQTRIYFEDEDNSADPLLNRIEQRQRVQTLLAKKTGPGQYRFDIRLQGDDETVFLDL